MCGICGFIDREDREILDRMTAVLRHRGPDDGGMHVAPVPGRQGISLHLGNRRLAIIDLSAAGHQPMANDDGSVWLTFNGEIYNYRVIRDALMARGYRFRSQTDTEVILHAYEEWGEACVERLDGMFAFGVWDGRRLLLARDRLGKKPLYYSRLSDGGIVFASEIKAILCHPAVPRTLDPVALDQYLTFQYALAPRTLFKGIAKLPAGHVLAYEDGEVAVREYWDPSAHVSRSREGGERAIPFEAAKEELGQRLIEAVAKRLVSDVPLGLLLSGGIDSSLVAALMTRAGGGQVRTFTVGFEDAAFDETPFARRVASHLGTEHHEFRLTPNMVDILPTIVWHLDEPVADQAILPTYLICQMAKADVTVLLTGEGGDEVFLGYPRYLLHKVARRYHGTPGVLRKALALGGGHLALPWKPYISRVLGSSDDLLTRNLDWLRNFRTAEMDALYTSEFRECLGGSDDVNMWKGWANRLPGSSDLRLLQYLDLKTWLADDILMKVDKMSMASSVEVRAPYLDHQLIEWTLGLPEEYLLRGLTPKRLLKSVAADYLPREVIHRPKQAFRIPTGKWLRKDLLPFARDLLLSPRATSRGYFHRAAIEGLLSRHELGTEDASQRIWSLLCLELWQQTFLDQAGPPLRALSPLRVVSRDAESVVPSLLIATDFPPAHGGIQTYISNVYNAFPGDRLTVIGPAHPEASHYDHDRSYRAIRVGRSTGGKLPFLGTPEFLLRAFREARRIAGNGGCAITHCGHVRAGIIGRHLKKRYGMPYLVWTYGLELLDRRYRAGIARTLREADLVFTISEYTRGRLLEFGVAPSKIVKICPRVDPDRFRPDLDGSSFRDRHGLNFRPILLTTGRLTRLQRYKGQDMVLRALPRILAEAPDVLYVIAGDGGDERYLADLARDLGVEAHVRILGRIPEEELPSLYAAADLFAMVSREEQTRRGTVVEGFGIVFLEASAAGKPVIGGNSGGIPEAVRDGITGLLVNPTDPDAIAAAVIRLLTDPGLAERLGRQGREWVVREMTWDKAGQEFRDALARFFP